MIELRHASFDWPDYFPLVCGGGLACKESPRLLDVKSFERLVETEFQGKWAVPNAKAVCPNKVPIKKGATFECSATVGDETFKIAMRQKDANGNVNFDLRSIAHNLAPLIAKRVIQSLCLEKLGIKDVHAACPPGTDIEKSTAFECSAIVEGVTVLFQVTQRDGVNNANVVRVQFAKGVIDPKVVASAIESEKEAQIREISVDCGEQYFLAIPGKSVKCTTLSKKGDSGEVAGLVTANNSVKWDLNFPEE